MTSLQELLADEGFRGGKLSYSPHDRINSKENNRARRRDKSRSSAFARRSHSGVQLGSGRDQAEDLRRSVLQRRSSVDGYRRKSVGIRGFDIESSSDSQEIEEVPDERYHVNYPDSIEGELEVDVAYSERFQESDSYKNRYRNDLYEKEKVERTDSNNESTSVTVHELKLDEIAVKATVAIITGYLRRFFKDESFQASLYRSCASCLGIRGAKETDGRRDGGVISNLLHAIGLTERTATGSPPNPQELKKAALQLSALTGLSSTELKNGLTCGIPNLHLAACAHLYLSVIYKFQKKDKASAKHLLQVFCDCPNQARSDLLPGLWDRLFLPHLSHLSQWYDHELRLIAKSPNRMRKMKLLEETYSKILDAGTCQFATYYKEWLVEGSEAPEPPSVVVPRSWFIGTTTEVSESLVSDEFLSPRSCLSPQATVSKKLYESVFGRLKKNDRTGGWKDRENEGALLVEGMEVRGDKGPVFHSDSLEQEDCSVSSVDRMPTSGIPQTDEWRANGHTGTTKLSPSTVKDLRDDREFLASSPAISRWIHASQNIPLERENELTLRKLAAAAFQPWVADRQNDIDSNSHQHNPWFPMNDTNLSQYEIDRTRTVSGSSDMDSSLISSGTEPSRNLEDIDQDSSLSNIPKDFICPFTGQLFQDPVTLGSGQTYERAAIKEWFDQGNKTCPVTKRTLESLALPDTNLVLKRIICGWKSEHCRNILVLATQIVGNISKPEYKPKDESALFVIEQLLTGFSTEEQTENARYLISLGGLHFLIRMLELGNLEVKTRVCGLLLCCIKANGFCRNYLAKNIENPCIFELLHCKEVGTRSIAVSLLIELICLNRRMAINLFVSGMHAESMMKTMHVLLMYLHSVPPEERVMVAVLLLHLDQTVEQRRYSIYREAAVDSIILALNLCLSDTKFVPNIQRALLILGGHFSSSGEILTEIWLLKQAGFYNDSVIDSISYDIEVDETILEEENEEDAREKKEWLKTVALILLGSGKELFLETLCRCLGSKNSELVRVCLTTVAWLSQALASLPHSEFQVSAFSDLILKLREILENYMQVELRVLASMALLNFSKISENGCKVCSVTHEIREGNK